MSIHIASRYAKALLELGEESGTLEQLVTQITEVAEVYAASGELRNALGNPLISQEAKKGILNELGDTLGLSPLSKNAIFLLNDRRRLSLLQPLARRLREMSDLAAGVVHAEVVSAAPLSESYYERLAAQLQKMTGKKVILDRREDPSLIAGVTTRIGDTVYDGSLRSRLESIKQAIMPA